MKRFFSALLVLLFLLCAAAVTAEARQDGDFVGTLTRAPKALERETPYLDQCELGCAAADAVRDYVGTTLALVSAADLAGDLPSGLVTWADVTAVFSADRALARAEITPAELYALLEAAVSHLELDTSTELIVEGSEVFGGFCQVSGFSFAYDVSAPVGERVLSVVLDDGTAPERGDDATVLTLAAPVCLLDGTYGLPVIAQEDAGGTLAEALADYIAARTVLPEGETHRIEMIGARNRSIVSIFPKGALAGGVAVLIVLLAFWRTRYNKLQDEYQIGR